MLRMKLRNNDKRIYFAQLLGMSDHISFNLSAMGYNVAKYVPYGPVKEVLPYLIRRAEENTSVSGQTSRELSLIKKEIKNRKLV
jgi:proline dehydrogenase